MKNLQLILLSFLLLLVSTLNAQKNITLQEAITIALNQNTNLVKSQNLLGSQEANVKSAYGNFLPNLNVSGSWSWQRISDDGSTQINFFGEQQTTPATQVDSRGYSLSAGGNITIFDGLANFANLSQKKNNYEAAKLDFEKLKQDVIYQTASLYFAVISYDLLLQYQKENYNYNVNLLNKINEMKELRMVPISDVYSQEVQTANSESALLQAQNNFEKAKIALLNFLSLNLSGEYNFISPEEDEIFSHKINESFDDLVATALSNRKDYLSQELKLKSSHNQLTIARADYLPNISGSYRLSTSSASPGDLFNRRVYGLGLSLNLPVFSRWATDYSVQLAEVQIKNTNEDLLNLERTIKTEVKNVMLDLQTAQKQVEVSQKAIQSAQESWNIKKESYELGKLTFIDLQLSYRDLLQSQNNNVQAIYSYYTKKYEMMNTLGVLGSIQ